MPAVFVMKGIPADNIKDFDWQIYNKPADAMVLDLADRQGNPVLMFWSKTATKCAVVCDVNVPGDFQLILHEFVVGTPEPPKPPDPPKPPEPAGPYQIMIWLETGALEALPSSQSYLQSSLKLRTALKAKGHALVGVYDQDISGPSGLPERLKPWYDAIKSATIPCIALAPMAGGTIKVYPLPQNEAALWSRLEGGAD